MPRDRRRSSASLGPPPGGSSGPARQGASLLAAYVDGVSELTAEERRALEERLASDDALRAEAAETRALLERLRELPRAPAGEPDWAALERSILDAVGPELPRPWWRRLGLRWAMPVAALAVGAAILALVVRPPARELAPALGVVAPERGGTEAAPPPPLHPGDTMALWLDGQDVEIDLLELDPLELDPLELELLEVPSESDHDLEDLLPASDLAWVDELVGEELERAEALLEDPELKPPVRRKRS
jgi:hypothetical protein